MTAAGLLADMATAKAYWDLRDLQRAIAEQDAHARSLARLVTPDPPLTEWEQLCVDAGNASYMLRWAHRHSRDYQAAERVYGRYLVEKGKRDAQQT